MDSSPEKVKPIFWKLLLVLALLCGLAWVAVWQLRVNPDLQVDFYDVGQGDAIFIKTGGGARLLMDGGPSGRVLQKVASDLPFFDRRIDLVVLTHPHADHITGLIEILRRYDVRRVLYLPLDFDSDYWSEFQKLVEDKKIQKIIARPGQKIILDKNTTLSVLAPTGAIPAGKIKDPNDYSIVSRLTFGKSSFLFLGDAGIGEVGKIAAKSLDSEVVKIGHHGSATATTGQVLGAVSPELAVISVGKDNQYNLPNPKVLELLNLDKIKYLRTDEAGDVRLESDGQDVKNLQNGWFFGFIPVK
jgi:competence protein ComEC